MPMKLKDLLEIIDSAPIKDLNKDVYIGEAEENYPYGPEYNNLKRGCGMVSFDDKLIIYSI